MAGMGPAPNPDAARTRSPFSWVELPAAGRDGPIPDLLDPAPWLVKLGGWPVATRVAWAKLWRTSAATQWQQCGTTLHNWAALHAAMELNGPTPAGLGELRQQEDRHGLSPKALLALRWVVVAAPLKSTPARSPRSDAARIDRRTRMLAIARAKQ